MGKQAHSIVSLHGFLLLVCVAAITVAFYLVGNREGTPVDTSPISPPTQEVADIIETPAASETEEDSAPPNTASEEDESATYRSIIGHIINVETGEPIEDIMIKAYSETLSVGIRREDREIWETRSDTTGTFLFDTLSQPRYNLRPADESGFFTSARSENIVSFTDGEQSKEITLFMNSSGVVSGRVYFEDTNEGVRNVHVEIDSAGGVDGTYKTETSGTTDEHGVYRVGSLDEGSYLIGLGGRTIPGFPHDIESKRIVTVKNGEEVKSVDFTLQRGLQLSGRVISPENILDHTMVTARTEERSWHSYYCESDGLFVISDLKPGEVVTLNVYPPSDTNQLPTTAGPFHIGMSHIEGVEIELEKGASISGVVVDRIGNPIPYAEILLNPSATLLGNSPVTQCDAGGAFSKVGLKAGTYTVVASLSRLSTEAGMHKAARIENIQLSQGGSRDNLRLICDVLCNKSISGRVTYENGAPAEGILVQAGESPYYVRGTISFHELPYAYTDINGNYLIEGLLEGSYGILFTNPVSLTGLNHSGRVKNAKAGDSNVDMQLPFPDDQPTLTVTGQVLDSQSGKPIPSFDYHLQRGREQRLDQILKLDTGTYYNQEGRFETTATYLAPIMTIAVLADGYTPIQQELKGPWSTDTTRDLTFKLKKSPVIKGSIGNSDGEAIAGAQIHIGKIISPTSWGRWDNSFTRTNNQGQFTLDQLSEGLVELWIVHQDYAPVNIEVQPRTTPRLDITLPDFGALEGTVFYEGEPVPKAQLHIDIQLPEWLQAHYKYPNTDANGRYSIDKIAPRKITVKATAYNLEPGTFEDSQTLTIESDKVTHLDFHLQPLEQ